MTNIQYFLTAALLVLLLVPGCARDTSDAGVKPVGVGYEPGDLFPAPERRGGVVDMTLVQTRGTNLDFGVTGFFGSAGAFTDTSSDPFDALLSFSYFFAPAIVAADELSLLTPKGPDLADACFVRTPGRGPLGSFRTVDVGEEMLFTNADEDPALRSEFVMTRDPSDYPLNTSSVFIYYVGTAPHRVDDPILPDNWPFSQDVELQFEGALPPENAPVASIPLPSDAADERAGKEAGNPVVFTPDDLTGVKVSNRVGDEGTEAGCSNPNFLTQESCEEAGHEWDGGTSSHSPEALTMRFEPGVGLPDPREGDGVLHVSWDAPTTEDAGTDVTISVVLLAHAEGSETTNGVGQSVGCIPAEAMAVETTRDDAWFIEYNARKQTWCDADFEPDPDLGNDEFGLDLEGADTCKNGIDDDGEGTCDETGCLAADGVTWLPPDPSCARHSYQTAYCGSDNLCYTEGGDRTADGHMAELICTAADDGDFVVTSDLIAELTALSDLPVAGAILKVVRSSEELIQVPMVRDQVGNEENINPVRLRASQMQFGRFDWGGVERR